MDFFSEAYARIYDTHRKAICDVIKCDVLGKINELRAYIKGLEKAMDILHEIEKEKEK